MKSDAIVEATAELEKSFKAALSNAEERVKKEKPLLKVSTKFEFGNPEERIVETAKKGSFDMIIMGSRGLGRRDYALGSVSSRVADCAHCPVLIVK
jgi:nucleotide-binding universal stress UspA family protein